MGKHHRNCGHRQTHLLDSVSHGSAETAYFIPKEAFESPDAATIFAERARAYRRAVRARSVTP